MPRIRLTKSVIDALPTPESDVVYWDAGYPGFGVKITPKGRKVFVVLYRTGGAGSRLRKYTIGTYGRVTLHQARVAAQKVFAARLEGRDLAAEKRAARKRMTVDRVDDLLEAYITQSAGDCTTENFQPTSGRHPARRCSILTVVRKHPADRAHQHEVFTLPHAVDASGPQMISPVG